MARKIDNKSTRQMAFAKLDEVGDIGRQDSIKLIEDTFSVKYAYARALYQQYRTQAKAKGQLTAVYVVRDHKNNAAVDPYLVTRHVAEVKKGQHDSIAKAVKNYLRDLTTLMGKASELMPGAINRVSVNASTDNRVDLP